MATEVIFKNSIWINAITEKRLGTDISLWDNATKIARAGYYGVMVPKSGIIKNIKFMSLSEQSIRFGIFKNEKMNIICVINVKEGYNNISLPNIIVNKNEYIFIGKDSVEGNSDMFKYLEYNGDVNTYTIGATTVKKDEYMRIYPFNFGIEYNE